MMTEVNVPSFSQELTGIDDKSDPDLAHYLAQVEQHLARLTCGLLTWSDFDDLWRRAWSAHTPPQQAVEEALTAEGFVVSQLPSPFMRQIAARQQRERMAHHGQT